MSLFRRKKRMIDVRELHKRYGIPMPVAETKSSGELVTDKEGFVEVGRGSRKASSFASSSSNNSSGGNFFRFMDSPSATSSSSMNLSPNTTPSEDLRKISRQISDLDNKLYKIEQRIELLERKAGVGGL